MSPAEVKAMHAGSSHPSAPHLSSLGRDSSLVLGQVDTITFGGFCTHSPTDTYPRAAPTQDWLWEYPPGQQRLQKVLHG